MTGWTGLGLARVVLVVVMLKRRVVAAVGAVVAVVWPAEDCGQTQEP